MFEAKPPVSIRLCLCNIAADGKTKEILADAWVGEAVMRRDFRIL